MFLDTTTNNTNKIRIMFLHTTTNNTNKIRIMFVDTQQTTQTR